jgi:hypothetical protein
VSDKIRFVARLKNHTLTLNQFNSTAARVLIQSNPINAYLQKGVLYEFDLNNDSIKEVRVRYGGMNGTKAMMFIQEIKLNEKVGDGNNVSNDSGNKEVVSLEKAEESSLWMWIVGLSAVILFLIYFWKRRDIKEHFKMRRLQRAVHYRFY